MKIPSSKIIPVGIALVSLVFICILSSFLVGSIIPGEPAYHYKCQYRAKAHPEKYDKCYTCGYWFSHKDMRMTGNKNAYRWDCNECKSRLEAYK